jgi:hypothetical protein
VANATVMGNVAADTMMTAVVDRTMMAAVDTTKSGDPDETAKVADVAKTKTKPARFESYR